MIRVG
jgi:hypothetical protein